MRRALPVARGGGSSARLETPGARERVEVGMTGGACTPTSGKESPGWAGRRTSDACTCAGAEVLGFGA